MAALLMRVGYKNIRYSGKDRGFYVDYEKDKRPIL